MTTAPSEVLAAVETAIAQRAPRRRGRETAFRCPHDGHLDEHPSCLWNPEKQTYWCPVCKEGGGWLDLARLLRIETRSGATARYRVVAEYPYLDEAGVLLYVVERRDPKDFRQRRPDRAGGWIWNLNGTRRVLYRLPELMAADRAEPVLIVEGEKDVDRLRSLGFVATCNPEGAGKWRPEFHEALRGRHVVVLPDADGAGRHHADQVVAALVGIAASVKVVEL